MHNQLHTPYVTTAHAVDSNGAIFMAQRHECEGEAPWALVLNTDATEEKDNEEGLNELQERLNTEAELLNDNYGSCNYGVVEI